jgi:hypothetical protein
LIEYRQVLRDNLLLVLYSDAIRTWLRTMNCLHDIPDRILDISTRPLGTPKSKLLYLERLTHGDPINTAALAVYVHIIERLNTNSIAPLFLHLFENFHNAL